MAMKLGAPPLCEAAATASVMACPVAEPATKIAST